MSFQTQQVDPWYVIYQTRLNDPEQLDQMIEPTLVRFREAGYQTAVLVEKVADDYLLHCIAVQSKHGQISHAVSSAAQQLQDQAQLKQLGSSALEPNQVSFG